MESHPPEKSASIDDLPNELLTIIFEQLNIRELIQCSSVCRRFKLICQHVKIPELTFSKKIENIKDLWFYTNKQFNHQDAIDVTTFCRYRSMLRLDKLKRLYFKGSKTEYDQLDVNSLTQLEQIRIDFEDPSVNDLQLYVDLPNLRIAQIDGRTYSYTFHVTAPKLEMLKCDMISVVHIVDHAYPSGTKSFPYASIFRNVELFTFPQKYIYDTEKTNVISMLPNLGMISFTESYFNNDTVDHNLHRFQVKFYIDDTKMDISKMNRTKILDELNKLSFDSPLSIDHHNSLRENIVGVAIDYNELMHLMAGEIPDNFFKKYFKTRRMRVAGNVENQDHLLGFLNKFEYLSELHLNSNSLDQSFYDGLGELNQLKKVFIKNSSPLISNFEFLLKLKLLERFETDSYAPNLPDLALALFSGLNYFQKIKFFWEKSKKICILRAGPDDYTLYFSNYPRLQVDFNGLIRALNAQPIEVLLI